jgi:hypothetical protein
MRPPLYFVILSTHRFNFLLLALLDHEPRDFHKG